MSEAHAIFAMVSGASNFCVQTSFIVQFQTLILSHPTQILVVSRSFRKMHDVRRRQGPVGLGEGEEPVEALYKSAVKLKSPTLFCRLLEICWYNMFFAFDGICLFQSHGFLPCHSLTVSLLLPATEQLDSTINIDGVILCYFVLFCVMLR